MSDPYENATLVELLGGIEDRRIRRKVKKLLQYGAEAVRSLGELDSALYSRENGEDQLQIVSDAVLSHVRRLLEYLGSITATLASDTSESSDIDIDIDIDFADGDSMDLSDAIKLLNLKDTVEENKSGAAKGKTEDEKWQTLIEEMDTMQYGLGSEVKEYDRRFKEALLGDRKEQALRDLNDATNSLTDGVFAMMTTAYEEFLGYADPDRMIPGYRDTLGKTLGVRRGLTELRREVQELNRSIQNPKINPTVAEMSFKLLVESLLGFIAGDVFAYLRPSDRREFEGFAARLQAGLSKKSLMDCEGLDKYLDSLAVVSQRDVLLKHDSDLKKQIFRELEAAVAVQNSVPELVPEMVSQAFEKADRLFGLVDELDNLVYRWTTLKTEKKNNPQSALELGLLLRAMVEPPKATPPPDDGDFF